MRTPTKYIRTLFLSLSFSLFNYAIAQQQVCKGSLEFDATNTAVQLPLTNQYYTATNGGFTWECWFKLSTVPGSAGPDRPLISAIDAVGFEDTYLGFGWHGGVYNVSSDSLIFKVDGPGFGPFDPNCAWAPSTGFVAGVWYYAAGVADYNNGIKHLYVNGILVDSKPLTLVPNTRVIQTNLSSCDDCTGANTLDGRMDEVRIWDTVLTASNINSNWRNCRAGTEPNLLLYYRCNQVAALNVLDATANYNNGVFLNNVPSWSTDNAPVSGPNCKCDCLGSLKFDASNTAVRLPLNNQYYSGAGYTWETWFKLNQPFGTDDRPLISAVDWTLFEDMYFGFGWHGGFLNTDYDSLVFRVEGPGSMWPTDPSCAWAPAGGFVIGQWYHAAGVADYNGGWKYLYVNGIQVDAKPLTVPPNTRVIQTNLSMCDGCTPVHTNYCNMDEVRIWDTVISPADIAYYYQKCRNGNGAEPNLLVYYRCNQVGATTVVDGSGNGNTGLFAAAAGWSSENAPVSGPCYKDCNRSSSNPPKDKAVGLEDLSNGSGLKIYPNPTSGSIHVSSEQPGALTLYSVTGQLLSEIKVQKDEHEVKLQGFKPGIYLYVFTSGSSTSSGKLVVE